MKQLIFIALIFAACNTADQPEHVTQAKNVTVSQYGAVAYYAQSDVQITLRLDGSAVVERGTDIKRYNAVVFQHPENVFFGDIGGGKVIRLNTKTGAASIRTGEIVEMYSRDDTP